MGRMQLQSWQQSETENEYRSGLDVMKNSEKNPFFEFIIPRKKPGVYTCMRNYHEN